MSLDYDGIPRFKRERDLFLERISPNAVNDFLDQDVRIEDEEDAVFDDIARVFLKGDALIKGLGAMNPLAFIPVEAESPVVNSLQRVFPDKGDFTVITFGEFKEACEFIVGRMGAINEEYLRNFNIIDPKLEGTSVTTTHKGVERSGDDWVTEFLLASTAFAGLMIGGFVQDVFGTIIPRATGPANEPKQFFAQGIGVGLALLIEIGVNFAALKLLFSGTNTLDGDIESQFGELAENPAKRKEVLEGAGYDYAALRRNQRYDDYKAIKTYCLNYIARTSTQQLNYDHWIGWLQVLENHQIVRGAFALAPNFSRKWRKFQTTAQTTVTGSLVEDDELSDVFDEEAIKSALNTGLRSYLSSILTLSNEAYNNQFDAFILKIDERLLCCLMYFLGPMDADTLRTISNLLKLATFRINLNLIDLLTFLSESVLTAILNMMASYVSQIIDKIVKKIFDLFFGIPETDIQAAIQLCAGIDILFKIFELSLDTVLDFLGNIVQNLNSLIQQSHSKQTLGASIYVERRLVHTIVALIDAIIAKLDRAKDICRLPEDGSPVEVIDDRAAEAALDFVVNELPALFPVLEVSEDVRRKHFRNTGGFVTKNLGIEIPGTDDSGRSEDIDIDQKVVDCAQQSPASKSVQLAQQIVNQFKVR